MNWQTAIIAYLCVGFVLTACVEIVRVNVFPLGAQKVGSMTVWGWILNTIAWPFWLPRILKPRRDT